MSQDANHEEIELQTKIDKVKEDLELQGDTQGDTWYWHNIFVCGISTNKNLFIKAVRIAKEEYLIFSHFREVFRVYKDYYIKKKLYMSLRDFRHFVMIDKDVMEPETLMTCIEMSHRETSGKVTEEEFMNAIHGLVDIRKEQVFDQRMMRAVDKRKEGDIRGADKELNRYIKEFSHVMELSEPVPLSDTSHMLLDSGGLRYQIDTPFEEINKLTGGMWKGEFWIVEGASSDGKTTVADAISFKAMRDGEHGLFITLEMEVWEVSAKMHTKMAYELGYNNLTLNKIRRGVFENDREKAQFEDVVNHISEHNNLAIMRPDSSFTIMDVVTEVERRKSEGRLDFVVIDYIELLDRYRKYDSLRHELKDVTRIAKRLANEKELVVISPHQVPKSKRALAQERKPYPYYIKEDLGESAGVEANAVVIVWIYQDEKYESMGRARMGICKNRMGKKCVMGWEISADWAHCHLEEDGELQMGDDITY